ncbi:MAG TPA: cytochrome P450 [Kofleriaceae bacterium]|nr:cytochrome P450 [Kofleriaceae bacterium]
MTEPADLYDLMTPAALADPFPVYRRLREDVPVHWSASHGGWLVTRYDDVLRALKDPRFSARRSEAMFERMPPDVRDATRPLQRAFKLWLLMMDPPDHTRLRALVQKAFAPGLVAALRPRIQALIEDALDRVAGAGRMDLIHDLAQPIPATVIAQLLGVDPGDHKLFKAWSDDLALMELGPAGFVQAQSSMLAMMEYLGAVVAERRRAPREDLLSQLLAAEEAGRFLDEDELLANCVLLLFAGHETTTNLIGNGILELLRHPDQLAILRDEPSLIEGGVEELLRFHGPIQRVRRTMLEPVELGGQTLRAGDPVWLLVGAANRDPAVFDDPETLDVRRKPARNLTFGFGAHFCVGAPLGRLEGQIAIQTILRRLPDLRGATDGIVWRKDLSFRGIVSLPLTFTPTPPNATHRLTTA